MGRYLTGYEKEEMERMKRKGITHREIGEQLGYSRMQTKEYFHRTHKKDRAGQPFGAPKRNGVTKKISFDAGTGMWTSHKRVGAGSEIVTVFSSRC